MGSTSPFAVLLEHKNLMGADIWNENTLSVEIENDNPNAVRFGMAILVWLPPRSVCEEAMSRYWRIAMSLTSMKTILDTYIFRFLDTFGESVISPHTSEKLATVSRSLCRNTAANGTKSFDCEMAVPTTTAEWLDSFTGERSRWDVLGIIFLVFGALATVLPETDPFLERLVPDSMKPRDYGTSMLEVGDACLLLCDELGPHGNLLSLLLLYRCVVFQSVAGGKSELTSDICV